jgi:hypothetical protein
MTSIDIVKEISPLQKNVRSTLQLQMESLVKIAFDFLKTIWVERICPNVGNILFVGSCHVSKVY